LRFAEHSATAQETHNEKDEIVDKANHAFDALKYDFRLHAKIPTEEELHPVSEIARLTEYVEGKRDAMPWEKDTGSGHYVSFEK
jgi:hypothetical protein